MLVNGDNLTTIWFHKNDNIEDDWGGSVDASTYPASEKLLFNA